MISNFWFVCVFFAGRMAWDLRFSSGLREPNFVANTVADSSVNGYGMSNRRMLCMKKTYSFMPKIQPLLNQQKEVEK